MKTKEIFKTKNLHIRGGGGGVPPDFPIFMLYVNTTILNKKINQLIVQLKKNQLTKQLIN